MKSTNERKNYKEEIISMVNAVDDLPTLAKIWSFVRLLFFK